MVEQMRVPITNVWFDNLTRAEAVAKIVDFALSTDRPHYVCTGNLDHLAKLDRDPGFVDAYREADLVLADGAPVLWLSRLSSPDLPLKERVAGSDLVWDIAEASEKFGLRMFFLGGQPGAANGAIDAILDRFPRAVVCGSYCPPLETFDSPDEQAEIIDRIRSAKPNVLFVALGAPKQEKWIRKSLWDAEVPVSIGIGGALEMAAGKVRRAPLWMQRSGMEWAYRFLQEPGRLFRRYFLIDVPFLIRAYCRELAGGYGAVRRQPGSPQF